MNFSTSSISTYVLVIQIHFAFTYSAGFGFLISQDSFGNVKECALLSIMNIFDAEDFQIVLDLSFLASLCKIVIRIPSFWNIFSCNFVRR